MNPGVKIILITYQTQPDIYAVNRCGCFIRRIAKIIDYRG